MLGLRPIPRHMLPDSMEVLEGCEVVARVGHVRLELDVALGDDPYGAKAAVTGTVYVDALHSEGAFEVPVGTWVVVRGLRLLVIGCRGYEAMNGNVHHWELAVSGERDEHGVM